MLARRPQFLIFSNFIVNSGTTNRFSIEARTGNETKLTFFLWFKSLRTLYWWHLSTARLGAVLCFGGKKPLFTVTKQRVAYSRTVGDTPLHYTLYTMHNTLHTLYYAHSSPSLYSLKNKIITSIRMKHINKKQAHNYRNK